METPNKFDYTMISAFLRCRTYYYLRIIRGLVGKVPPTAANFGKWIHKALDVWFETHDIEQAIEVFRGGFNENPEDQKRTHAVATKLLKLYAEKYEHEPFKILETEITFDLPIAGDFNLTGRIDKIVDWDKVIHVMDHKTTSRLGYEFFYKIKPNMQFDGYIWAARQMGYKTCSSVLLDALLVAKGLLVPSQLSKLTPLARLPDTRSEEDLKTYVINVKHILYDIIQCYKQDVWYQNTDSCDNFIECPYRRICKEARDIQERIIEMDYIVSPWDPLKESKDG